MWLYCCYSPGYTHFLLKRWCEAFELIKLDSLINTSVANFDIDNNTNILNLLIQYQYQYQYLRIWKGIPISISIPQKSELNNNTNINTQIFQIQYQAQYNTEVSRYFAISRQYQKRSSRYRAFMREALSYNIVTAFIWPQSMSCHPLIWKLKF